MKLLKVQTKFETISQPQIKIKICSKINYQKKVKKKNEKDKDKENFLKNCQPHYFVQIGLMLWHTQRDQFDFL